MREPLEQPEGHVNAVEATALALGLVMRENLLPCRNQWFERRRSTAQHCLRESWTKSSQALIKAERRGTTEVGIGIGLDFAQDFIGARQLPVFELGIRELQTYNFCRRRVPAVDDACIERLSPEVAFFELARCPL